MLEHGTAEYEQKLKTFFDELSFRRDLFFQTKKQADIYLSSDFNVFDVIAPDENKLSDILANILNSSGNHGQGDIFLKEFLKFAIERDLNVPTYDDFAVRREVSADGRIDLLLESANFAIIIENKPFASDQQDQLNRYYKVMHDKHGDNVAVVYLNKNRQLPQNYSDISKEQEIKELLKLKKMIVISYLQLKDYITICYQKCDSNKYRFFLKDFVDYIQINFFTDSGEDDATTK